MKPNQWDCQFTLARQRTTDSELCNRLHHANLSLAILHIDTVLTRIGSVLSIYDCGCGRIKNTRWLTGQRVRTPQNSSAQPRLRTLLD
jgi:hypothetical protein